MVRTDTADPLPLYAAVAAAVVVAVGVPATAMLYRARSLAKAEAQVLLLMDTPTGVPKTIANVPFHSPERALVIHSPGSGSGRVAPL